LETKVAIQFLCEGTQQQTNLQKMATTIELTSVTRDPAQTTIPIPTVDVAPAQNAQSTVPSISNTINQVLQTQQVQALPTAESQIQTQTQTQSQTEPNSLPPAYLHPPTYIQTPPTTTSQTGSTSPQIPHPIHPRSYAYEDFNDTTHSIHNNDENNNSGQQQVHEELPAYTPPLSGRLRAMLGQPQPGSDMIEVDEETLLKRKKRKRLWFSLILISAFLIVTAVVVSQVRYTYIAIYCPFLALFTISSIDKPLHSPFFSFQKMMRISKMYQQLTNLTVLPPF